MTDAEFIAGGNMRFTGTSGNSVTNLGSITAREGDIFLLGASVTNAGTLTAANGTVGLAAGERILVSATGDERVFVEVGSGGKVEHSGEIRAAMAVLKAKGTDPNGTDLRPFFDEIGGFCDLSTHKGFLDGTGFQGLSILTTH